MPRPIPMSHDRRSTIAASASSGGKVGVGPLHEPAPPRRVDELLAGRAACGCGLAPTARCHSSVSSPSMPEAWASSSPSAAGGSSTSYCRTSASADRVRHAQPGEVELVGAVHSRIGHGRDRGAPVRQLHADQRLQRFWPASGHVAHGQRSACIEIPVTCVPSWRSVTSKWWKSSSSPPHTTPGSVCTSRMRRRYGARRVADPDDRRGSSGPSACAAAGVNRSSAGGR